jgi:hypothetical protein
MPQLRPLARQQQKQFARRQQTTFRDLETNWLAEFVDPAMQARFCEFKSGRLRFRAEPSAKLLALAVVTAVAIVPLLIQPVSSGPVLIAHASTVAALIVAAISLLLSSLFFLSATSHEKEVAPADIPPGDFVPESSTFCLSAATLVPACWIVMQTVCSSVNRHHCLNDKRDACSFDLVSDVAIDLRNKSEVPGLCGAIELQHLYAELTATLIVLLAASAALEPTFKELFSLCLGALACCIASVVTCEYITTYQSCEVSTLRPINRVR